MTKSAVRDFAETVGIPVFVPEKIRGNTEFLSAISALEVDYLVVVAYGKILPKEILELPQRHPINIHGSLLPKYRGASPVQSALLAGETETGITFIVMGEAMDDGDMLAKVSIAIDPKETSATLFEKLAAVAPSALKETILRDWDTPIIAEVQNHKEATYCTKISKEDGKIDFLRPAIETFHKWQAYTPWPGIWCELDGKRCKILDVETISDVNELAPGECKMIDNLALVGFIDHSALQIITLQCEGKKPMSAVEFLKTRGGQVRFL